jgi:hypothetical protein
MLRDGYLSFLNNYDIIIQNTERNRFMTNRIEIISRNDAEKLIAGKPLDNTAIISFYAPPRGRLSDCEPLDYSQICDRVFMVEIHDIDIEVLPDFGLTFDEYFPEAYALAGFIKSAVSDGCDIICQCEYGQSRFAACAAAIREYYDGDGIKVFADYKYYPNQLIFNKLLNALKNSN